MMSSRNAISKQQFEKLEAAKRTGHRMIGRRDLLSHGLIAGVGTVMMPSLLSWISRPAFAQGQSCGVTSQGRIPFLNIDLAGGANLIGANFMVGGRGGQLDLGAISYTKMGQVTPNNNEVVHEFGIAFHPKSPVLQGLRESTTPELRGKMDGCLFAAESVDDSLANEQNPSHWIVKSGTRGTLVPQVGLNSGKSAGRQPFPKASVNATSLPVQVRTDADARSLAQISLIQEALGENSTRRVLEAVSRMSDAQLSRFNELELPHQIREMVKCGYLKSSDDLFRFQAENLSVGNDTHFLGKNGAFVGGYATNNVSQPAVLEHAAAVTKLVLQGIAGAGTIELAGRDYHGQPRATTDNMDRELGQILGRCITAAARLGKSLMIHIMSDGSVSGEGPVKPWYTDSQAFSAGILLVYHHTAQPQMQRHSGSENSIIRNPLKRQVGSYTSHGIDFTHNTLVTDNKLSKGSMARCVVANYLALHGEEGRLSEVIGESPFDAALDEYLVFKKIA